MVDQNSEYEFRSGQLRAVKKTYLESRSAGLPKQ